MPHCGLIHSLGFAIQVAVRVKRQPAALRRDPVADYSPWP